MMSRMAVTDEINKKIQYGERIGANKKVFMKEYKIKRMRDRETKAMGILRESV